MLWNFLVVYIPHNFKKEFESIHIGESGAKGDGN